METKVAGSISIGSFRINKEVFFKIWISLFHIVGIIGLSLNFTRPVFQLLTPFHLLMCAGILLYFHQEWNRDFKTFLLITFFIGMASEIMGVQTGVIFGDYIYGDVLGPKIWGVPLVIGLNWFILAYMAGSFGHRYVRSKFLAAILGAICMVVLDIVIEPVAVALGFWTWHGEVIPLSNYIGWFATAFIMQVIFQFLKFKKENVVSFFLFLNMALFFLLLGFTLSK